MPGGFTAHQADLVQYYAASRVRKKGAGWKGQRIFSPTRQPAIQEEEGGREMTGERSTAHGGNSGRFYRLISYRL